MEFPEDLKFTDEHEWIKLENGKNVVWVGITEYAQEKLGDVVHVELPQEGDWVHAGEPFGSVESVKAVSDLYAPLTGEVIEVNSALEDSPELVNDDPYQEAWMIKVAYDDEATFKESLMEPAGYQAFIKEAEEN